MTKQLNDIPIRRGWEQNQSLEDLENWTVSAELLMLTKM